MEDIPHDRGGAVPSEPAIFAFSGPAGFIAGTGAAQPVERGPAATLDRRLAAIQGRSPHAVIGGPLPFSREDDDFLWQARTVSRCPAAAEDGAPPIACCAVRSEPAPALYAASVAHALRIMARHAPDYPLEKVVLARTLAVEAAGSFPQDAVFRRIAQDRSVTAFRVMLPDEAGHGIWTGRALIGASPELLLQKDGDRVASHPLAGSARRQPGAAEDRAAREALEASEKDRREHRFVVDYILDILAPHCSALSCPEGTAITSTGSMWHLGTRIEGRLRDPAIPSILLAQELHPTPAVCGVPCARAASVIRQLEPVDRRFYAGAVGWCDLGRNGDGAWFVAIRCADICGARARLYAGAGIVSGSDPAAETAETGAKFSAMLKILGLPADAGMPAADAEL